MSIFKHGKYSSLNENGINRLTYLNTCATAGGTIWEILEGLALLEMCHWGVPCGSKSHTIPHFLYAYWLISQELSS